MRARTVGFILLAIIVGFVAGETIFRSAVCRDLFGLASGRGHLLALVNRHAIYEDDLHREIAAGSYLSGQSAEIVSRETITKQLIREENIRQVSAREAVPQDMPASQHRPLAFRQDCLELIVSLITGNCNRVL